MATAAGSRCKNPKHLPRTLLMMICKMMRKLTEKRMMIMMLNKEKAGLIMSNPITSLSIAARMTLNMHSLNNEGGEGNQIQTRMIDILGADKVLHSVNAI